jgi:cytochrome b pre-mRNA-processing protein 3
MVGNHRLAAPEWLTIELARSADHAEANTSHRSAVLSIIGPAMPSILLSRLLHGAGGHAAAERLYAAAVAQARRPEIYADWRVPDTVDGRFDAIALHVFLVLHRLKAEGPVAAGLAQDLFDTMFADMDRSLREMGTGDLGVGRRVRAMAEGFYGRIAAYEAGLDGDAAALAAALRRNLYGGLAVREALPESILTGLCRYVHDNVALLADQGLADLAAGQIRFATSPTVAPQVENSAISGR